MPETCSVLLQNKIGIIIVFCWLFKKKSITMHGNMNVKHISCVSRRRGIRINLNISYTA